MIHVGTNAGAEWFNKEEHRSKYIKRYKIGGYFYYGIAGIVKVISDENHKLVMYDNYDFLTEYKSTFNRINQSFRNNKAFFERLKNHKVIFLNPNNPLMIDGDEAKFEIKYMYKDSKRIIEIV